MTEKKAKDFYEEIKHEENKYRLVNGLFIVKYIDDNISFYVGDFLKHNTALNDSKSNIVIIKTEENWKHNNKDNTYTTSLGFWKPLNINFKEQLISCILGD